MFRKTGTLLTAALLGLTTTIGGAGPAAAAPADAAGGTLSRPPTDRYLPGPPLGLVRAAAPPFVSARRVGVRVGP
ncbi:hypothetical protein [Micromonospora sp. NPDC005174]|uniref:hypothetical protein n=1 Tax=unclassified Micromonospora TaxID=2617518 RepID=UPI0033AC4150